VVISNEILEENLPSEERSSVKFLEGESGEKVLGLVWNNSKDAFTFKCKANELSVPSQENSSKLKLTKRKILSKVARVFDPIAFAAAFLIRAKIGLQRLWQQGLDWDEELSSEVSKWWTEFFAEIEDLNNVTFPRSLTPPNTIGLRHFVFLRTRLEMHLEHVLIYAWKSQVVIMKVDLYLLSL
jgi:hypothetical protein